MLIFTFYVLCCYHHLPHHIASEDQINKFSSSFFFLLSFPSIFNAHVPSSSTFFLHTFSLVVCSCRDCLYGCSSLKKEENLLLISFKGTFLTAKLLKDFFPFYPLLSTSTMNYYDRNNFPIVLHFYPKKKGRRGEKCHEILCILKVLLIIVCICYNNYFQTGIFTLTIYYSLLWNFH